MFALDRSRWVRLWTGLVLLSAIFFLGYTADRSQFTSVIIPFSIAFAVYFHWTGEPGLWDMKDIWTWSVISRLILFFSIPTLSDDYFRFIWDGQLIIQGVDPFAFIPSEILEYDRAGVYDGLNSKHRYTSYPTIMQAVFAAAAAIGGKSILLNLAVMRMFLLGADLVFIRIATVLLPKLGMAPRNVVLYALNPLLIVEGVGNLHFEGMMMCFTIIGLGALVFSTGINRQLGGVLALGLGVLTKMTSLITVPSMVWRSGWYRTILFGILVVALFALGMLPFWSDHLWSHFGESLQLYFRNFRFSPSLYGLVDYWTEPYIPHYRAETIGPWVSGMSMLALILVLSWRRDDDPKNVFRIALFLIAVRLAFASTVHPWYLIDLMAIGLFTSYRFPFIASYMLVFSYHFYGNDWEEIGLLTFGMYFVVYVYAIWEIWSSYRRQEGT